MDQAVGGQEAAEHGARPDQLSSMQSYTGDRPRIPDAAEMDVAVTRPFLPGRKPRSTVMLVAKSPWICTGQGEMGSRGRQEGCLNIESWWAPYRRDWGHFPAPTS